MAGRPSDIPTRLLSYKPFLTRVSKLGAEWLNEDLDASDLWAALRERFAGLDSAEIEIELDADAEALGAWREAGAGKLANAAAWLSGAMAFTPDVTSRLVEEEGSAEEEVAPRVEIDLPKGWKAKEQYGRLDLKKGRLVVSIDPGGRAYEAVLADRSRTVRTPPGQREVRRERLDVVIGRFDVIKFVTGYVEEPTFRSCDYLLTVNGSRVCAFLGTTSGAEFDESEFEKALATLRIVRPSR